LNVRAEEEKRAKGGTDKQAYTTNETSSLNFQWALHWHSVFPSSLRLKQEGGSIGKTSIFSKKGTTHKI
jgi:hypothetical protein